MTHPAEKISPRPVRHTQARDERRTGHRRRVLKGAHLEFAGTHGSIPCAVRNISDTGARVNLAMEHLVPERFSMVIELDGLLVECRAVWRTATEAGLEFLDTPRKIKPMRMQVISPRDLLEKTMLLRNGGFGAGSAPLT